MRNNNALVGYVLERQLYEDRYYEWGISSLSWFFFLYKFQNISSFHTFNKDIARRRLYAEIVGDVASVRCAVFHLR